LSVALLWAEQQSRIVHPLALPLVVLFVLLFGAGIGALIRGLNRSVRGARRAAALGLTVVGVLPALLWVAAGANVLGHWRNRQAPRDLPSMLVRLVGASLMEGQARWAYPHRLTTEHLVMFYDDGVADPESDAEEMDRHVARLQEMTGLPGRGQIWWVRGPLLGQERLAFYSLALGSSASPAAALDRHELAHAVLYQQERPDSDPPTLLLEGWAEAQSLDSKTLASRALIERLFFTKWGRRWPELSGSDRARLLNTVWDKEGAKRHMEAGGIDSYLRELTSPYWYHRDTGAVYTVGGAFVAFLIRRDGCPRFVDLYFACRPGTFQAECERLYGVDLDALEAEFWQDAERLDGHTWR
jgi:hypothetical protein